MKRLVDLTQPWGDRMPTWPQFASIEVTDITTHHRDRKSTMLVKTNMHTGTHIDAPSHYWETGRDLGRIELSELYGTALVIDLRPITRPWSYYSLADIEAHVPPGESIRDGDIVVLYTGWDRVQLDQADARRRDVLRSPSGPPTRGHRSPRSASGSNGSARIWPRSTTPCTPACATCDLISSSSTRR